MESSRVVHPSADVLRALALNKLDAGTAAFERSHVDSCPACRASVAVAHDSYATQAPMQSFVETTRPQQAPLGPTTLFNVPPELADNSEYEVLRELGRGGMGVVYQARHKISGRLEVLKVMSKALIGQPESRERFLREIQAVARLDHRNIVTMYNALERGELMVLVMEYVDGEDLARAVKARGPLSVLNACYYVQQAAAGLQHAFEKGMVHRDIKPQNLMLIREGKRHTVKVLDFGLANATRSGDMETGLTGTGAMMGTPGYVAPEQILDAAKADIRADVYSLGCTLYHLLAGGPPFTGKSLFEILDAHRSAEAKSLSQLRPEVPEELAAVVRKMMAKEPAARYRTPAEVMRALDPFVKPATKAATPKTTPERPTPSADGTSDVEIIKKLLRNLPPNPAPAQEGQKVVQSRPAIQETRIEGSDTIYRGDKAGGRQTFQVRNRSTRSWFVLLAWLLLIVLAAFLLVFGGISYFKDRAYRKWMEDAHKAYEERWKKTTSTKK